MNPECSIINPPAASHPCLMGNNRTQGSTRWIQQDSIWVKRQVSRTAPVNSSVENVPDCNGSSLNNCLNDVPSCITVRKCSFDNLPRKAAQLSFKGASVNDDVETNVMFGSPVSKQPKRSRDQDPDVPLEPVPAPPLQDPGDEPPAAFLSKRRRLLSTPTMAFIYPSGRPPDDR